MRLDERAATSVHEAGHACLAVLLGIPISEVESGLHTGFVKPWPDDATTPEDMIIVQLAGSRAAFALGEAGEQSEAGGADDRSKAATIARELGPDTNATLARLHWRTATLVHEHAGFIAAFANELLTHRRLAGDELQRALDRAFMQSRGGPR